MGENQAKNTAISESVPVHIMSEQPVSKHEPNTTPLNDTDMEGVESEVSRLAVRDDETSPQGTTASSSKQPDEDEIMDDEDSAVPGLSEDEGSDAENEEDDDNELRGQDHKDSAESAQETGNETVDATDSNECQEEQPYQSESAASSSSSLQTEPSIISIPEAIYSAVQVSSELYIIPHASKGFKWNEDLFLKPHQRRSLGVDELYSADGSDSGNGDSAVTVHEIHLDEDESRQILPF